MITPEQLKVAKLREHPFLMEPRESSRVAIWAGHHELKETLLAIVKGVRNDVVGLSEFIVLHGDLGTGKSHALRYLQNFIENPTNGFDSPCIYIETLRLAEKVSFLEVYRRVLVSLGEDKVRSLASSLVSRIEEVYEEFREATPPEQFKRQQSLEDRLRGDARAAVLGKAAGRYGLFKGLSDGDEDPWFFLAASRKARLSAEALSAFGVTSPIDTDFEAISHIAMITNLACGVMLSGDKTFWKAFYLFIDEAEIIAEIDPRSSIALNHAFRDLLNACPEHLCLMFGATADAALVETALASALLDRMTRKPIVIPPLDEAQALDFIREVLQFYRPPQEVDPWHPFTPEAAEYVVSETTHKTPRNLFRNFRQVLDKAANSGVLTDSAKIDRQHAEDFMI